MFNWVRENIGSLGCEYYDVDEAIFVDWGGATVLLHVLVLHVNSVRDCL